MGDISRHRDIFLNTRDAIPSDLLGRCRLSRSDLTYLELGNYFTDVSQFRDPVFYLYAKQTVWREEVLPGANDDNLLTGLKALGHLAALGGAAALASSESDRLKALAIPTALLSPLLKALNSNINDFAAASILDVDDWLDRMLGKPIEKLDKDGKRKPEDFGYIGRFFQHFIEGVTQMLFASDVTEKTAGEWATIDRLPPGDVTKVFGISFTQYFPHEHTDQPPYVWDASKRPGKPMYEPGPRRLERAQGIMNIVYEHYINYLAEGLSKLEEEYRTIDKAGPQARQLWLARVGKILHGVEDWYFHSNIVELIRLRAHKPDEVAAGDREAFVKRIIALELRNEPEFSKPDALRSRLQRYFYRRLRFPVYSAGTRESTGGVASKTASTLNWDHAYPAFPSTLDSAHTLMGALEGIERKFHFGGGSLADFDLSKAFERAPWLDCVMRKFHAAGPEWSRVYHEKAAARNVTLDKDGMPVPKSVDDLPRIQAWAIDVLRELVPLFVTLLYERERQRLLADVAPMDMPLDDSPPKPKPGVTPGKTQARLQIRRHVDALKPKKDDGGVAEHNYARAARYMKDCGSLNEAGRVALVKAFDVDIESEKKRISDDAPGAGGFLIKFAMKLQKQIDQAELVTARHDREDPFASVATDNGSDNEIIGSHSLMSKDTKESSPFFDDARVLGSVASLTVFQVMLEEVSTPGADRLNWQQILRRLIRFPVSSGGWERQVLSKFVEGGRTAIPKFADLAEFQDMKKARMPVSVAAAEWQKGERAAKLRQMYVDLEKPLTRFRYP